MTNLQSRYYNFFTKLFNYEKRIKLIPVDFAKPWWTIIWQQKTLFGILLFTLSILSFYDSIISLWIAQAVESGSVLNLGIVILGRVFFTLIFLLVFNWNPIFQLRTIHSVAFAANQRILEVDPISHSTKSSGVMISKVNKGSGAFEDMLDILSFELLGVVVELFTTVILLMTFDLRIGLIASFLVITMAILSVFTATFNNATFKPKRIEAEDIVSQISVENIQQASYVRSVFATPEQLTKLKNKINKFVGIEATSWRVDGTTHVLIRIVFFVSVFIIAALIMQRIEVGAMSSLVGVGLITSYVVSSNNIRSLGSQIKRLTASHSRITDLFEFMREFGQQSYPVVGPKIINK
jgi:ABC-type multidrug transport system fused ATPase/permease subunit